MIFNKELEDIKNYEAGKPIELVVREYGIDAKNVIKLASNENPFGTSQKVVDALKENSYKASLYPDDSYYELKNLLANKFNLNSSNIILGAGSDQVIEFCIRAKCNPNSKVLMAKTTFAMYEIYSKHVGANIIKTNSDMHNLNEFRECYKLHKPDLIFLCLPNNPLGECLDREDVYQFISEIDTNCLVVVDGAYQEYASYKDSKKSINPLDLITKFPNAIYLGTFSKAYGLGGMRVGYGIGNFEVIKALYKVRPPFNVTTLSSLSAIVALSDEEFIQKSLVTNFQEMERYIQFANSKGVEYIDSFTNFITLYTPKVSSTTIYQKLLENGLIIRDLKSYGLNAIRVTIGLEKANDRFFELFEKFYC